MRAAEIVDGKVFNLIEVESLDFKPNLVEAGEAKIGDLYVDGVFSAPPEDPERAKAAALAEIERLEQESMMNRGIRELSLVSMFDIGTRKAEMMKAENTEDERTIEEIRDEILSQTPAYVKFKALDDEIRVLRDQYNAIG